MLVICFCLLSGVFACQSQIAADYENNQNNQKEPINLVIDGRVSQLIFYPVHSLRWNGVIVFVGQNGSGKLYFPESFIAKSQAYNLYLNEVSVPEGYFGVHVKVERKALVPEMKGIGKDESSDESYFIRVNIDVPESMAENKEDGQIDRIEIELPQYYATHFVQECNHVQYHPGESVVNDAVDALYIRENGEPDENRESYYRVCLEVRDVPMYEFSISNYSVLYEKKDLFPLNENSAFFPERYEYDLYAMVDQKGFFNASRSQIDAVIDLLVDLNPVTSFLNKLSECRNDWLDRDMFAPAERLASYKRILYEIALQTVLISDDHILQSEGIDNLSEKMQEMGEVRELKEEIERQHSLSENTRNVIEVIDELMEHDSIAYYLRRTKLAEIVDDFSQSHEKLLRGLSVAVNVGTMVQSTHILASALSAIDIELVKYRLKVFDSYVGVNIADGEFRTAYDEVMDQIDKLDQANGINKYIEALKIVYESEQLDSEVMSTAFDTAGLMITPFVKKLVKVSGMRVFILAVAIDVLVTTVETIYVNCVEYKKETIDSVMLATMLMNFSDLERVDQSVCNNSNLDEYTAKFIALHMTWLMYYKISKDYIRFFPALQEESSILDILDVLVKNLLNMLIFNSYENHFNIDGFELTEHRARFVIQKLEFLIQVIQSMDYYDCILKINQNNPCGNGLCERAIGEGCSSCPIDCACRLFDENTSCVSNTCVVQCGDNKCHSIEQNSESCCSDCGCALGYSCEGRSCKIATCGDSRHVCDRNGYYVQENCLNCPEDCGCGGDTYCSARRTCEPIPITCPNGSCENGEDCWNCSSDCGCEPNELCFMYSDNEGGPQCCFPHVYSRCQDENTIVWYNSCDKTDPPVDCIENHQCKMNGNYAECVKQCEPNSYSHCQNGNTIVRYDSCDNFEIVPCGENQVCEIDENGKAKCKDGPICENFCQSVSFCEDNNIHCLNNCQQDIVQEYCGDKSCVEETRECCYLDVKQVCSGGIRYWQDSCGHHIYYGIENCHERGDNWRCRTDRDDENMTKCCQGDDHQECDHNRVYGVDSCGNRSREEDCDYTDTVCHEESGVAWCGEEEEHCGNGTCEPSLGEDCDFCVQDCGCDFDYEFCNSQGECEEQTEQCSYNHDEGELKACSTNDYPSCGEVISSSSGSIRGRMIPVGDEDYFILEQSVNFPVYLNLNFQDIGQETLFDRMQVCVHWRNMSYSSEQSFFCREGTWCSRDDFSYGDGWTDYGCCIPIFRDEWSFLRIQIGEQNDTFARGQFLVAVGQVGSNLYCGGRYQFDYSIEGNDCIDCF